MIGAADVISGPAWRSVARRNKQSAHKRPNYRSSGLLQASNASSACRSPISARASRIRSLASSRLPGSKRSASMSASSKIAPRRNHRQQFRESLLPNTNLARPLGFLGLPASFSLPGELSDLGLPLAFLDEPRDFDRRVAEFGNDSGRLIRQLLAAGLPPLAAPGGKRVRAERLKTDAPAGEILRRGPRRG